MPWAELLDELERGVDDCERCYLAGDHDAAPVLIDVNDVDPDLGPLPEHLAARARAVLRRMDSIHLRLSRIPRPAADTGRTRFAGASSTPPVTIDRTA